MHPSLDELLACRDGEGTEEATRHVARCLLCSKEIETLREISDRLRNIPARKMSGNAWPAIAEALAKSRRRRRVKTAGWLAAASLAAILVSAAVFLPGGFRVLKRTAPRNAASIQNPPELKPLMTRSRELEKELMVLEKKPVILKGRTAGFIAGLQDEVAIVDLQISLLQEDKDSSETLVRLWKQRVELLSTLVQVRSGEDMSAV